MATDQGHEDRNVTANIQEPDTQQHNNVGHNT